MSSVLQPLILEPLQSGIEIDVTVPGTFNVQDYGAVGNSSHDDTAAFQACFNAAIAVLGNVVIPATNGFYKLTSTVTLCSQPSGGAQFLGCNIQGNGASIRYTGANNTAVFYCWGMKYCSVRDLRIYVEPGKSGVVIWDMRDDPPATSTGSMNWDRVTCTFYAGCTSCVGWRMGHGGTQDVSFYTFTGCGVSGGGTADDGHIGWASENTNVLCLSFVDCAGSFLNRFFTTVPTSGSTSAAGGGAATFVGCSGTGNNCEFELGATNGPFAILGGRWERAKTHLRTSFLTTQTHQVNIHEAGVVLAAATGDGGGTLWELNAAANLTLDQVRVYRIDAGQFTASMIKATQPAGSFGTVMVRGGIFPAADPFYTATGGEWFVDVRGACMANLTTQQSNVGFFNPRQTYSIANAVVNRNYDAATATIRNVADALGTLVADLRAKGLVK